MQTGKGPGHVYSLSQFVYTFYKLPLAQAANAQNENNENNENNK